MRTRVLIVDDHAGFRAQARRLLRAAGYAVIAEAEDGTAGVEAARRARPDLVLLDVLLPDIDGFEAARRMLERDPGLDVVLTSTRSAADFGRRIDDSGARGFVAKIDLSSERIEGLLHSGQNPGD